MNYDHVGYLIKNYLWGVNELPSTILRHIFTHKKNKASQKTKNRTKTRKTQKINFNDCIPYQL